jgi:two-component system LytT family response regulator
MKTIRAIIVDDEPLAIDGLKNALSEFEDIEVIRECSNGFEAVQSVQELKPDLLFLDIQMPKIDGFDVVELLGKDTPLVVFVTAYDEYAIKAFEAHALDYLLKPTSIERLKKTLERAKEELLLLKNNPYEKFVEERRRDAYPLSRILIRDGTHVHIVPVNDILYLEAQDDYVCIYTAKESFLKNERLSNFEDALDSQQFCRIHRSYIINISCLNKIEPYTKDSRLAIMKNGRNLPISRAGYARLMELL